MPKQTPTVAIMYGFAEGSWHSRELRRLLTDAGFALTSHAQTADIIIAHSAGSYYLPRNLNASLIMHVGFTYWPGKSLFRAIRETIASEKREYGVIASLRHAIVHIGYVFYVPRTRKAIHGYNHIEAIINTLPARPRHVFVRPQSDPYCHPDKLLHRTKTAHRYVALKNGSHNDIWYNPERYVNLLQSVHTKEI